MKIAIVFIVILGFLFFNCNNTVTEDISSKISGTYINLARSNFSIAVDTVIIMPYNKKARTFIITHKTGFSRISNGEVKPKQHKQESSIAWFDIESKQLKEQQHRRVYSFPSSYNEFMLETAHYQKVE